MKAGTHAIAAMAVLVMVVAAFAVVAAADDASADGETADYTVTYTCDTQTVTVSLTLADSDFPVAVATPSGITAPAGKTIAGWSLDGETPVTTLAKDAFTDGAVTLKAVLADETADYTVTYTVAGNDSVSVTVTLADGGVYDIATPEGITVAEGYTISGWTLDGTAVKTLTAPDDFTDGTATLVGVLVKQTFTVTFQYGDGKTAAFTVDYGAAVTAPTDTGVTGKIFDSWCDSTGASLAEIPVATADATYTAKYVSDITLRFVVDGSIVSTTLSALAVPDVPAKDGYTALGWTVDGGDGTVYKDAAAIKAKFYGTDSDVMFLASYEQTPTPTPTPTPSTSSDNSAIMACLAIVAAALIVGGIVFVWTLKKEKD